jgi:predicted nuclease with TOPRIM domain
MKSEERIIELLAEYLKKTEQLLDRMDRTDKSVEIMSRALAEDGIKFNQMNEKFNEMNEKFNEMNQRFDERNQRFEEKFTQMNSKFDTMNEKFDIINQDIKIMLGELISLSKRVSVIEEK